MLRIVYLFIATRVSKYLQIYVKVSIFKIICYGLQTITYKKIKDEKLIRIMKETYKADECVLQSRILFICGLDPA